MTLGAARWHVIAESNFAWEREALDWLRSQLPDRDPWHVWTNFEFIDDEGKVSEVDALVLSPAGLFLVEIKSRPGVLTATCTAGRGPPMGVDYTYDNPLSSSPTAKPSAWPVCCGASRPSPKPRSACRLLSLRSSFRPPVSQVPAARTAKTATFQRGQPGALDDEASWVRSPMASPTDCRAVDGQQARAIARGLAEAGIRPSNKHRQVGDYSLIKLIAEGEGFQDWEASTSASKAFNDGFASTPLPTPPAPRSAPPGFARPVVNLRCLKASAIPAS